MMEKVHRIMKKQLGQAATEFLIAAVFLLVPLFLIVPLLGKYIDIKHAAIQNARFSAWEYTVWYGEKEKVMEYLDEYSGKKEFATTEKQGIGYFFTDPTSPQYGTYTASPVLNPLWHDHRGIPLFNLSDIQNEIKENNTPFPLGVIGDLLRGLADVVGGAFRLLGKVLGFFKVEASFDAINNQGYFTSKVNIPVRSPDQVLPDFGLTNGEKQPASPVVFTAKAAVQTNNWNAGGRNNATTESRGLVVTSLLAIITNPINKVLKGINDALSWIPLFKIKIPVLPEFGYVEDDLVPFDHIEGNKKKLEGKLGLYSYE